MHVHIFEWDFAYAVFIFNKVLGHHDHARDPKKDNIVACDQYRGG